MFLGNIRDLISYGAVKNSFAIIGFLCSCLRVIVDFPPINITTYFVSGYDDEECAYNHAEYQNSQPKSRETTPISNFTKHS